MQRFLKTVQNLSNLSSTVRFTSSQRADFFKYTSGRWLYNEEEQNASRYVRFNVDEIQKVACAAVGAHRCVGFKKLNDGSYNKVYALDFDNGVEAIAHIPCALAGAPFLTTASEVATLEFVRDILGIPAPRVFAWSADASANRVGAEYIIMEKISGVESHRRWKLISKGPQVFPLLDGVFNIESKFECAPFSQIGSLYFADDVHQDLRSRPLFSSDGLPEGDPDLIRRLKAAEDRYRIGPIADRQWWRAEREQLTYDHGPWPEIHSFLLAAVDVERTWLRRHAEQNTLPRCRRFPFHDVSAHLKILDMLSQTIPHLILPATLTIPTLWHPDISHSNLFVAQTGPAEVQGLINWQHSIIAPYCMQAQFPSLFVYEGGVIDIPEGRVVPTLPSHVSTLSPDQQEVHRLHLKLAMRHKVYEQKIVTENERRWFACAMPFGPELTLLPYHVLRSWSDSLVPLRKALLDLREVWEAIGPEHTPCPILFTDEEVRNYDLEFQQYTKYKESGASLNDDLDCGGDGWVPEDRFSNTLKRVQEGKANWDNKVNGGPFPYQDGSFSFFLS